MNDEEKKLTPIEFKKRMCFYHEDRVCIFCKHCNTLYYPPKCEHPKLKEPFAVKFVWHCNAWERRCEQNEERNRICQN